MRKPYLLIVLFLFLFLRSVTSHVCFAIYEKDVTSKMVCLAFFGTSGCHYCEQKWSIVSSLENKYPTLIALKFDYMQKDDRELQDYLFKTHNIPSNSPRTAVFVGNDYLLGESITTEKLETLIKKYLTSGARPVWRYIYLAYFGFSGCFVCEIDWEMINKLKEDYPKLVPVRFDCRNQSVIELESALFGIYGVEKTAPSSAVFIGNYCFLGDELVEEKLRSILEIYASEDFGTIPPWKLVKADVKLTLPPVSVILIGGLADGINPCAFTVLIFFISYLSYLGKGKNEIALTGASFILAVFVAYLIIGFGLTLFLAKVNVFTAISVAIKISVAFFALILGFINIYDYLKIKSGRADQVIVRLPKSIHIKIHSILRKGKGVKFAIPFAFVSGLVISLFELTCTGQVYFPIITLLSEPNLQVQSILYLILYNIMFVFPLIIILMAALIGVGLEKINKLIAEHSHEMKLLTASVLLILAAILITQSLDILYMKG